jgi:hypothetical protein
MYDTLNLFERFHSDFGSRGSSEVQPLQGKNLDIVLFPMHSDQKDNAIIVIWKDLVVYQNVGLVGTNDTVLYCTAK